jgi:hypothetical protein
MNSGAWKIEMRHFATTSRCSAASRSHSWVGSACGHNPLRCLSASMIRERGTCSRTQDAAPRGYSIRSCKIQGRAPRPWSHQHRETHCDTMKKQRLSAEGRETEPIYKVTFKMSPSRVMLRFYVLLLSLCVELLPFSCADNAGVESISPAQAINDNGRRRLVRTATFHSVGHSSWS